MALWSVLARPTSGLPASWRWSCAVKSAQARAPSSTGGVSSFQESCHFFLSGRRCQILTTWGFAQAFRPQTYRQSSVWMAESCSSCQTRGTILPARKEIIEKEKAKRIAQSCNVIPNSISLCLCLPITCKTLSPSAALVLGSDVLSHFAQG